MKKLSVIVPVHNELAYTRWCLLSVVNRTKYAELELIIVNDRSDEKTTTFLKNFTKEYGCKYVETERQSWHSSSCNLGYAHSTGEYVCFLNSDTIVSTDWDRHMIQYLETDYAKKHVSVVGPSTSYCASHQNLPQYHKKRYTIKYHETDVVAKEVFDKYEGKTMVTRVTGFCLFYDRKRLEEIGLLDAKVFPSAGNESDWLLRGIIKGLDPVWVKYAYVHHFGEASYVKAIGREDKIERWRAADQRLIQKYGKAKFDVIQNKYWKNQKVEY